MRSKQDVDPTGGKVASCGGNLHTCHHLRAVLEAKALSQSTMQKEYLQQSLNTSQFAKPPRLTLAMLISLAYALDIHSRTVSLGENSEKEVTRASSALYRVGWERVT